jgi:ferredoxin
LLPLSQRVAFSLFAVLCLVFGARGFYRLYLRIARGRADVDHRTNYLPQRLWYALRTTLLQTRVFRKRRILSVFHSFIFYAFVLYILVNGVDAIDGFYDLRPIASPFLRTLYGSLADLFSVLAIVGVLAFVLRRFFSSTGRRDFRFNDLTHLQPAIRNGYIQRDSLIVSAFILFHVGSRIIANAARLATEGPQPGQPFSTMLSGLFAGPHAMAWRIFGYWGALGSVLLFLAYFPYTKHIHLLMAPVKYFVRRDAGSGELPALTIDAEALEAPDPHIGAALLADLSWPRILDAYACIQCNRCQDVCPASQTGKALSPAALEINKRMVLNSIAAERSPFAFGGKPAFEQGTSAGPALLDSVISDEAVWACTTCGACMQVCPTQDEQMLDIIDIRRNQVMLHGEFPSQLQTAFRGMERTSNPWGIAREKRMAWADGLDVPTIDDVPNPDVLYWVGCAASYDPSAQKTARATVQLLKQANVNFAVLGKRESCTGDTARRAGNELLYQELATTAIGTLNEVRPKTVIAS